MMVGTKQLIFLAVYALYAQSSAASPIYQEDDHYDGHHHEHHHGPPPATSYATISTTHVKVQHPPPAPPKYETPYKYEYLTQPQIAYKYISLPSSAVAKQQSSKFEEPSTTGYKYLAASPTYKYVKPPVVNTDAEAAEVPTNSLKYAFKYEQNSFKQEQELQQQLQQQQQQQQEYEQPAEVQYKYIAVPTYKYVQQVTAEPEYDQHHLQQQQQQQQQVAGSYDFTDDKQ